MSKIIHLCRIRGSIEIIVESKNVLVTNYLSIRKFALIPHANMFLKVNIDT